MLTISQVPTSAVSFVSTDHGRLRRKQRGIDKKCLQKAVKYGTRQSNRPRPNGDSTSKYTYKDIVYIVNDRTAEEVTSWAVPINLEPVPISNDMHWIHVGAESRIREDFGLWTSNTVIVVDRSGSMRTSDIWGARNRLGSVWISVALDFLAHRIESGAASTTDVVSVVTLEEQPTVVIREQPCTWVLYNELAELYNKATIKPKGHGPFLPSLDKAEELLNRNDSASCAMALVFLSDGKPSDRALAKLGSKEQFDKIISDRVGSLAKKFGRRLTFTTIGIGDSDDFGTLEKMAETAKDYGATASFRLPSMTSSSLGDVFTSVATSLTTTQTEMTDVVTLKQRKIRNVERESRKKASQHFQFITQSEFWTYRIPKVRRTVYNEYLVDGKYTGKHEETSPFQNPDANFAAMCKNPFGEGGERFAYRFYELAADRCTIIGTPLVAKESRLLLDEGAYDERARKKFVLQFCRTQQLARRIAEEFNEKLDSLECLDKSTPRVSFLDCSVYHLRDDMVGELSVLVEEKLDHNKWYKWNANNGYVAGMSESPSINEVDIFETMIQLTTDNLAIIDEDEEEESDDEDQPVFAGRPRRLCFTPSEVAQAFSHFSYVATGRKRLICDLQGVFDEKANVLRLSDPVIHYHSFANRKHVHGRTDRGARGIGMFFKTHECNQLCSLVNRGHRRPRNHSSKTSQRQGDKRQTVNAST